MNANRKQVINFFVNGKHDHWINKKEDRHVQPHMPKKHATKPKKIFHDIHTVSE